MAGTGWQDQGPANATSIVNEASRIVKTSPGLLFSATGYNAKSSQQWIQFHDSTSLPADNAVPKITFLVPATSNWSIDFPNGRQFSSGIVICNSAAQAIKTIGSTDCWFDAQFY